jgi:putative glycosyltransferase (TIGR04372 family)
VPVIATVRRFILAPMARLLLRLRLGHWNLADYDVLSVGAHKFGHLALEPLIGHLESRRRSPSGTQRRILWTLGPRRAASNPKLHSLWRRELTVYPRHLLGLSISSRGPYLRRTGIYGTRNVLDIDDWRPQLTTAERDSGHRFLREHGWDGRQPLVGVVINEGLHYGKSWTQFETERDPHLRVLTFRVDEFRPLMTALVHEGLTVVRLGSPPATPVTEPGVIDYATSVGRSSALDVILPGLMNRVISTQTGPDAVALMFGVPVTYLDVARLKYCFFDVSTVHWRPAILETSEGQRLGLRELLSPAFIDLKTPDDFAAMSVKVHRATTAERFATALEGLRLDTGDLVLDDNDRYMQKVLMSAFVRARENGILADRGDASALVSPEFLRQHGDWYLRGI